MLGNPEMLRRCGWLSMTSSIPLADFLTCE